MRERQAVYLGFPLAQVGGGGQREEALHLGAQEEADVRAAQGQRLDDGGDRVRLGPVGT